AFCPKIATPWDLSPILLLKNKIGGACPRRTYFLILKSLLKIGEKSFGACSTTILIAVSL
ncbi:MAG: hypothetical protein IIX94_04460, partial [Clostridia bacterium]|nr:hypothetical protein [Clostridia bacterium]